MKFADQLSKETIRKFNQMFHRNEKEHKDKPQPKHKPKENLSRRDIEELMGKNRDIYKRHNGAIRRK